ncbi:unnamed protein product [Closterium sp. Naga37s-1]|nr:unnamed protein product [Closterium sp. Naga37s-1]
MAPPVALHVASLLSVANSAVTVVIVMAARCAMSKPARPVTDPCRAAGVAPRSAHRDIWRAHVLPAFHSPPTVLTPLAAHRHLLVARRQLTATHRQLTAAHRQLHAAHCAPTAILARPPIGPYAVAAAVHSAPADVVSPGAASMRFPIAFPFMTAAVGGGRVEGVATVSHSITTLYPAFPLPRLLLWGRWWGRGGWGGWPPYEDLCRDHHGCLRGFATIGSPPPPLLIYLSPLPL